MALPQMPQAKVPQAPQVPEQLKGVAKAERVARLKIWLITTGTFLVFVVLAVLSALFLKIRGRDLVLLVAGVLILGLLAALMVFLYLSARARKGRAQTPDEAVDAAMAAARSRLAAVAPPGRLPAILVLGPTGSAKTTTIAESGLEPELLAGEGRRDVGTVPPTSVNVWYAQGTLFVEAGGALLEEPGRWLRLLRHLRPRRLRAALTGRPQAPRQVIVCFPCDEFVRPGAAQTVPVAAQGLRERLLEVARQFGVRIPVYVLFTRADRFPHFAEYVRNLSRAEAQELLGAAMPVQAPAPAALYAEREAARVSQAFLALVRALALARDDLLRRENDETARQSAYEFPRELRKASELAIQFLVELTRPSHLGVSALLRGFYFTGVRPVVVDDASAAAPVAAPRASTLDATGVFDPRMLQGLGPGMPPGPRTARRVPEWVFVRRLFPEVVLADRAAKNATARGAGVDTLRRIGLAAAAVICLIAAGGFTISFMGNRGIETDAIAATRAAQAVATASSGTATADALRRLDSLRAVAARLRNYDVDGAPMHLRWGLYAGGAELPEVRRAYFAAFDRLLWRGTRANLIAFLRALPPLANGTAAYVPIHDALRAHLVTTSHPEASTGTFLAPVLLQYWHDGVADPERTELARRQFEFFGAELPFGNPFNDVPDAPVVTAAQAFLLQFGDSQRLYAALLTDAARHGTDVQFSRIVPTAAPTVRDEVVVPAAFTRDGWAYVHGRLRDVNRLFDSEPWVLGRPAVAPQDRARLARELGDRYAADYIAHWQAFLQGASVGGLGDAPQAAQTLQRLSDAQSPLLRLLSLASTHTAVDTAVVRKAFQPVGVVVPPGATDRLVSEAAKPYMQALAGLQGAVQQAATAPPAQRAALAPNISNAATQLNAAVLQLSQGFSIGVAGDQVRRLLGAPANALGGLVAALPSADVKGKGQGFCQQIGPMLAKYPFNPRSTTPATPEELGQLFQPGTNAFTTVAGALPDLVVQQGPGYAAKLGAEPQPSPAFIALLNRAVTISRALYEPGAQSPVVQFSFRPQLSADVPEVTVAVDGQTHQYTRFAPATFTFAWDAARAHDARITAKVRGSDVTLSEPAGTWSIFRLMQDADWQSSPGGWTLRWKLQQGGELAADIGFQKGGPVFSRDYFSSLSCVGVVR